MYSFPKRISPGEYHQSLLRMESVIPMLPQESSKELTSLLETLYAAEAQLLNGKHKIVLKDRLKTKYLRATELYKECMAQDNRTSGKPATTI